jgi:hypothetical protein
VADADRLASKEPAALPADRHHHVASGYRFAETALAAESQQKRLGPGGADARFGDLVLNRTLAGGLALPSAATVPARKSSEADGFGRKVLYHPAGLILTPK